MELHPEVRQWVETVAAEGGPSHRELGPAAARKRMRRRETGLEKLPVEAIEDRSAPGRAGPVPVRVYRPAAGGDRPVLVWYHGGGWVLGDLDTHDALCRRLAREAEAVVVAVHYRRAPEAPFPAAVDDARSALTWAFRRAGELGGDPHRLAVGGDSAGGNLAAVEAAEAQRRGRPPVKAQALVYPIVDADFETGSYRAHADGPLLTRDDMRWFWDAYVPDPAQRADPRVAPLRRPDVTDLAPAVILVAGHDPLCDEGLAYAKRLREAGVPVDLLRFDDCCHGFFSQAGRLGRADAALQAIVEGLRCRLAEGA